MNKKIIKNEEAQINFGFILSVVLLAILLVFITTGILNLIPGFADKIAGVNLRARAVDLSKVLFEDPGSPADWTSSPTIIGLAKYNNYSDYVVVGALDSTKVDYVNSSIVYSALKSNLSLGRDINFWIIMRNSTGVIMDYYNSTPAKTDNVVSIKKYAVINGSQVNITLLVW